MFPVHGMVCESSEALLYVWRHIQTRGWGHMRRGVQSGTPWEHCRAPVVCRECPSVLAEGPSAGREEDDAVPPCLTRCRRPRTRGSGALLACLPAYLFKGVCVGVRVGEKFERCSPIASNRIIQTEVEALPESAFNGWPLKKHFFNRNRVFGDLD